MIATGLTIFGAAKLLAGPDDANANYDHQRFDWSLIFAGLIGVLIGVLNFFGTLYVLGF